MSAPAAGVVSRHSANGSPRGLRFWSSGKAADPEIVALSGHDARTGPQNAGANRQGLNIRTGQLVLAKGALSG